MYLYRYKIVERVCSSYSHEDFLEFNDECESDSELTEIYVVIVGMVAMKKSFVAVVELPAGGYRTQVWALEHSGGC